MLETAESFRKLVSEERYFKLKRFRTEIALDVYTYVCVSTFCTMKQVKSENRNRMADERLDDTISTGSDKGTILSGKPRPQASH